MQDADILQRAAEHLVNGRADQARAELRELSKVDVMEAAVLASWPAQPSAYSPRPGLSQTLQVEILRRDCWLCRYCGRKLVAGGVLALIGKLCPGEFPFPPGHHMPTDRTHPAAIRVYPNVDHVRAGSSGGAWSDPDNLVAACTPCNERKSNRQGWIVRPPIREDWTGLTEFYRALAGLAGSISATDRSWLRALGMRNAEEPIAMASAGPDPEVLNAILHEVKALAVRYYALTNKPLGVTGEVAELEAAEKLGLTLAPARTAHHDAFLQRGERTERYQIKGRAVDSRELDKGRVSAIKCDGDFEWVLLVLLDRATFDAVEIWQASREDVAARLQRPGSKARNERAQMEISQFKSIASKVWPS